MIIESLLKNGLLYIRGKKDTFPSDEESGQGGGGGRSCQTSCFVKKI